MRTSVTSLRAPAPTDAGETQNAALIALLRENREQGAAVLFRRFSILVNQWVLRIVGADADHNDMVQTIFCRLIDTVHRVREPEKLDAWVRAVSVNVVLQELRRRRSRRLLLLGAPHAPCGGSFVQDLEARDLLRRARRLLDLMPPAEHMVFLLHYVEGESLATIAADCGFSLPTAKRRLAKAGKRFEQLIEREPELKELLRGSSETPTAQ